MMMCTSVSLVMMCNVENADTSQYILLFTNKHQQDTYIILASCRALRVIVAADVKTRHYNNMTRESSCRGNALVAVKFSYYTVLSR